MSTDFICPVLYCLLQHRPKIFSILLKMFSTRNTDKLSEVCLRRTKLSPFIGGVGEKVIFGISSFCSDAGNKRFDHKMIFKPQNGTKDMKKNPNKWYFNHHVDYWSKKKNTMEVIVLQIYIAICQPSFPSYLGTVYCIYKDSPKGVCIMKVACTSKEVGLQSNCQLGQSEGRCFC